MPYIIQNMGKTPVKISIENSLILTQYIGSYWVISQFRLFFLKIAIQTSNSDFFSQNCEFISHNSDSTTSNCELRVRIVRCKLGIMRTVSSLWKLDLITHNCEFISHNSEKQSQNCEIQTHICKKKVGIASLWKCISHYSDFITCNCEFMSCNSEKFWDSFYFFIQMRKRVFLRSTYLSNFIRTSIHLQFCVGLNMRVCTFDSILMGKIENFNEQLYRKSWC